MYVSVCVCVDEDFHAGGERGMGSGLNGRRHEQWAEWEEAWKRKSSSTCLRGCPSREDSIHRETHTKPSSNHKVDAQGSHNKEAPLAML